MRWVRFQDAYAFGSPADRGYSNVAFADGSWLRVDGTNDAAIPDGSEVRADRDLLAELVGPPVTADVLPPPGTRVDTVPYPRLREAGVAGHIFQAVPKDSSFRVSSCAEALGRRTLREEHASSDVNVLPGGR